MTPEEEIKKQAEEQEKKAKEIIDSTIRIPLTDKQAGILRKIVEDKKRLEQEFGKLNEKETELVTFTLEFKGIDQKQVQELKLSELGDALVVVMKSTEKKDNNKDLKASVMEISASVNGKDKINLSKEGAEKIIETLSKEVTKEHLKAK